MERRKLYNRALRPLPPSTRWRESKRMAGASTSTVEIDPAESDAFAEHLVSRLVSGSRLETDDYLPEGISDSPDVSTNSSTLDFVNGLVHSFSESDASGVGDGSSSVGDTSDFVEDLMQLTETDSESELETRDFVEELVLSYETEEENNCDTSYLSSSTDHHVLDSFTPYEDQDSNSDEEITFSQPLYDNAPLSDSASRQAIMHFALANHLSYAAVDQLLALLKSHLPSTAGMPKNSSSLRRQFVDGIPLQQYYCPHCFTQLDNRKHGCRNRECKEVGGGTCYFVPVSIAPHFKEIFSSCWSLLQYPFTRSRNDHIHDIQDGEEYQQDPFFSVPEHTGLIMNTDGIPVFNSSKSSLWPVLLSITSLPPAVRMNKDYVLLAGVWFGPVKPQPSIISPAVLDELRYLHSVGIDVSTPDGHKKVRAKLLFTVCDLPAKAMILNQKQYNGYFGCAYCFDEGVYVSRKMVYIPSEQHRPRTHARVKWLGEKVESTGECQYGIKGTSMLTEYSDVVKGVPIDYMHAVLEGVTKNLMALWYETKYSRRSFSLSRKLKVIDEKLLSVKPPHEFRRSPRSIATSVKYWKASEYRAWLLFYSLPIAAPYLPAEYAHHYSLLVYAMHILLGSDISSDQLKLAEQLLLTFYQHMPDLYGEESCKINFHYLLHLSNFVRMWGPLWVYSCFGFENMNGHLKKMFHGTSQILGQLVFTVKVRQSLALKYKVLHSENRTVIDFLGQYIRQQKQPVEHVFVGRRKRRALTTSLYMAVKEYTGLNMPNTFETAECIKKDGVIFRTEKDGYKRCSSYCTYVDSAHGREKISSIQAFVVDPPLVILHPYRQQSFVVASRLSRKTTIRTCVNLVHSMSYSVNRLDSVCAMTIDCIKAKCIYSSGIVFRLPNSFEHH